MSPRLEEFTTEQLRFALTAIKERLEMVEIIVDGNKIAAGKCKQWEALTLWNVQLTMALERSERVDKTWSN